MQLPRGLLERVGQGKIIPFVGAGLSRGIKSKGGDALFPSWSELLIKAADELRSDGKIDDADLVSSETRKNLLVEAANHAEKGLGRSAWLRLLKDTFDHVYDDADPASLALLQQVWGLGSNLVITTNYDRSLQWTCPDRADFRVWDIEAKVEQIAALRDGVRRATVWHLHGQIDNAAELIVTSKGYTDLYGNVERGRKYKAALEMLRSVLTSRSLLFLGFSLQDAEFMKQLLEVNDTYDGAAGQHYALLPKPGFGQPDPKDFGVEPIYYDHVDQLPEALTQLAIEATQSPPVYVRAERYIVHRAEGLYLFGGRGDAFFKLYDEALHSIQNGLDIFSLKLSRFRQEHESTLIDIAQRSRVRIALLDPRFPLPEDHCSLASIREREEKSSVGAIRRDVAAWATVQRRYQALIDEGTLAETPVNGLEIKLYNILPTINLFRVDKSLFVGPYLLDVPDRETPTFLIKSEAPGHGSMGTTMFSVYQRHFDAVWNDGGTRPIASVDPQELEAWRDGRSYTAP
jgi:hypothetical protein